MNDPQNIVAIIAIGMAMILAVRGLSGRGLDRRKLATMALVWVAIIAGLAILLTSLE